MEAEWRIDVQGSLILCGIPCMSDHDVVEGFVTLAEAGETDT